MLCSGAIGKWKMAGQSRPTVQRRSQLVLCALGVPFGNVENMEYNDCFNGVPMRLHQAVRSMKLPLMPRWLKDRSPILLATNGLKDLQHMERG